MVYILCNLEIVIGCKPFPFKLMNFFVLWLSPCVNKCLKWLFLIMGSMIVLSNPIIGFPFFILSCPAFIKIGRTFLLYSFISQTRVITGSIDKSLTAELLCVSPWFVTLAAFRTHTALLDIEWVKGGLCYWLLTYIKC